MRQNSVFGAFLMRTPMQGKHAAIAAHRRRGGQGRCPLLPDCTGAFLPGRNGGLEWEEKDCWKRSILFPQKR